MKLTKNFSLNEFKCHDGTPVPDELIPIVQELACALQRIRDEYGLPIHINSAYRTPEWNESIGGVKNSQHTKGTAADIRIEGIEPVDLAFTIDELAERGEIPQGGIGIYNSFVHYDIRGYYARWNKTHQ